MSSKDSDKRNLMSVDFGEDSIPLVFSCLVTAVKPVTVLYSKMRVYVSIIAVLFFPIASRN